MSYTNFIRYYRYMYGDQMIMEQIEFILVNAIYKKRAL